MKQFDFILYFVLKEFDFILYFALEIAYI